MKTQLNKGKTPKDTFYLIKEYDNKRTNLIVVNGVTVGSGYQQYISPGYFMRCDDFPQEARTKLKEIMKK